VYWISLDNIPKNILNNIRMMFSFLWIGKKIKEGIHLISWNKIAKPKKWVGGALKILLPLGKL
jgi:hypothetical protein